MMKLITTDLPTPLGELRIVATNNGLCAVAFVDRWPQEGERLQRRFPKFALQPAADIFDSAATFRRYLAGDLTALDSLPLDMAGTEFQLKVWQQLRQIPFGKTWSYQELAARIGNLKAMRAVGAANGRNPLAIVVPCHRVIGSDGQLTGYAGGIHRKRWLLEHEGAIAKSLPAAI